MTRAKAIKGKCQDCSADSGTSVRCCPVVNCPLWIYRFGRALQGGYKIAFLDRDFFEVHVDTPEVEFNHLLLARVHQRSNTTKSE